MMGVLHLEQMGGITMPYKQYIEANLTIPALPQYNEDVLFLVVANHKYGDRISVQIGTQVIGQLVATMTKKELQKARETWRQVHLSTIVLKRNTTGSPSVPEYDFGGGKKYDSHYEGNCGSTIGDYSGKRYGRFDNTSKKPECCCWAICLWMVWTSI